MLYRLIDRLFKTDWKPAPLTNDQAKCVRCRRVGPKSEMVQNGTGWFCAPEPR